MISEIEREIHEGPGEGDASCHLWLFRYTQADRSQQNCPVVDCLSAEEVLRAHRFRSAERRQQFEESRHGIRQILSRYVNASPADVCLTARPSGRPVVLDAQGTESLSISISHTAGVVALAIARVGLAVGVDIEDPDNLINESAIRKSFLTDAECSLVERSLATDRKRLILQLWTAKEAAFKAGGEGVLASLMEFASGFAVDSLAFGGASTLYPFCVPRNSVEIADSEASPMDSIVGSFVCRRKQVNAFGIDVRSPDCFNEVAENHDRIVAALAAGGVQCTMLSVLRR